MIQRCENKNSPDYPNWGGRGIKVCERWRHSPENFYADMGDRPPGTSLDRINNDGDYEPGNCRWATKQQQTLNSRYKESLAKAVAAHAKNMNAMTHCRRGHEYTPENTRIYNGCRRCKTCFAAMERFRYYKGTVPLEELMYPIGKPGRRPKDA